MFVGRYTHTIDAKGRLTVPQRLRKIGEQNGKSVQWERAILTLSLEFDSIHLYVEDDWKRILEASTLQLPIPDPQTQRFLRLAGSVSQPIECDQLGRIVLPNDLKEMAGIEREALWIGATLHAEIWNPERWQAYFAKNQGDYPNLWDVHSKRTAAKIKAITEEHAPHVPEAVGAT